MSDPGPIPLRACAFWYLRHGETDWNAQNLSQGRVEVPLNEHGIAQAKAAAAKLRNRGIASVVCSPLGRARATAAFVSEALGLPVQIDEDFVECAYGEKEGKPMAGWFQDWVDGKWTPAGAESFAELRRRATAAVNRALDLPPPLLVISHGAVFRGLRAAMGLVANVRAPNAAPMFCAPPPDGHGPWTLTAIT
jgi:probable phosphoglycerate mutase